MSCFNGLKVYSLKLQLDETFHERLTVALMTLFKSFGQNTYVAVPRKQLISLKKLHALFLEQKLFFIIVLQSYDVIFNLNAKRCTKPPKKLLLMNLLADFCHYKLCR